MNVEKMTLRDYFAGQCLNNPLIEHIQESEDVAKACYEIAEAMLKEKERIESEQK